MPDRPRQKPHGCQAPTPSSGPPRHASHAPPAASSSAYYSLYQKCLDAAYRHLAHHAQLRRERVGDGSGSIASDFTLLERNERWSLYCHYRNGDTRLMIQLSEIKPEDRGFANPHSFTDHMYDYLSGRYGVRFEETAEN